jgi:hypothetical protein
MRVAQEPLQILRVILDSRKCHHLQSAAKHRRSRVCETRSQLGRAPASLYSTVADLRADIVVTGNLNALACLGSQ